MLQLILGPMITGLSLFTVDAQDSGHWLCSSLVSNIAAPNLTNKNKYVALLRFFYEVISWVYAI